METDAFISKEKLSLYTAFAIAARKSADFIRTSITSPAPFTKPDLNEVLKGIYAETVSVELKKSVPEFAKVTDTLFAVLVEQLLVCDYLMENFHRGESRKVLQTFLLAEAKERVEKIFAKILDLAMDAVMGIPI
ncbi:MAG: hypothetical protein IAF58_00985 [Leptolyngbya sp.]|nr:hypothetical protein [Candidatus Melainabacteria bacterium]